MCSFFFKCKHTLLLILPFLLKYFLLLSQRNCVMAHNASRSSGVLQKGIIVVHDATFLMNLGIGNCRRRNHKEISDANTANKNEQISCVVKQDYLKTFIYLLQLPQKGRTVRAGSYSVHSQGILFQPVPPWFS